MQNWKKESERGKKLDNFTFSDYWNMENKIQKLESEKSELEYKNTELQ